MNLLNEKLHLSEIEYILVSQMQDEKKNCRIIKDLELSKEDYIILVKKLKTLMENRDHLIVLDEFKFSLVVALVFALSYEDVKKIDNSYISYVLYPYPQHHEKYIIRAFEWAFDEYYLNTYGIRISTISDVLELMVLHTGIPSYDYEIYFESIERSFENGGFHSQEVISENLPKDLRDIFSCVGNDRKKYLTNVSRDIYYDYKNNKMSQSDMMKKYSWYSSQLMQACFDYCDRH